LIDKSVDGITGDREQVLLTSSVRLKVLGQIPAIQEM